jgi:hypothetical protein
LSNQKLTVSAMPTPSDAMATSCVMPLIAGMPPQFWWTPDHAACVFSTKNGRFPKRQLPVDQPYPAQVIRTDMNHDIQKKARSIAREFPELAGNIQPTNDWYHLYKYWDAVDIWVEGAGFCLFVINLIGMVNKQFMEEKFAAIDECAKEWVTRNEE